MANCADASARLRVRRRRSSPGRTPRTICCATTRWRSRSTGAPVDERTRLAEATLAGHGIRLEPLAAAHVPGLREAVADGEIHRIPFAPHVPAPEAVEGSVARLRADVEEGTRLAWAVVRDEGAGGGGRVVGLTTFMNLAL